MKEEEELVVGRMEKGVWMGRRRRGLVVSTQKQGRWEDGRKANPT